MAFGEALSGGNPSFSTVITAGVDAPDALSDTNDPLSTVSFVLC